jgi:hypothetical protein
MTSEEGVYQGGGGYDPPTDLGGEQPDLGGTPINEPAAWPQSPQELVGSGWSPAILATAGSVAAMVGAWLFARRRSKRSGLMAAMPSQIAEASEQMMRGRGMSQRSPLRAMAALGVFALAGWGIRRTMAHIG